MGKDSLIKSTTKKAGSKKEKKSSKKKPTAKAAGAPVTKDAPVKPKSAKKTEPALTLQDLLLKQFSRPQTPDDAPPPAVDLSGMTAPPLITSNDPQEVARLRALLERRFSMEEIAAAAQAPVAIAPPAPPKAPVSLEELLYKKFSTLVPPDDTPAPAQDLSHLTAPPFISSNDPQEVERLQGLLAKRFSMAEIAAAAQAPVAIAPPVVEAAPQPQEVVSVKAPEPPPAEPPQAEVAPPAQSAPVPEPATESIPAQTPEPPITETPAPAPTPAPEPVAPKLEERKEAPAPADSGWRSFKIGIAIAASVFLLIVWGSFSNSGKYFVMPKKGAIEIWQGTFSPTGKEFVAVLHGVEPAAAVKESYNREEISPILCNYYIGKADALLDVSGLPDYKAIADYLQRAKAYAMTDGMRTAVQTRIDNIQRLSLMYKAEIEIGKGTIPSLQSAVQALKEVQRFTTEPDQLEALNRKIAAADAALAALEAKDGDAAAKDKAGQGSPTEASHAAPEK